MAVERSLSSQSTLAFGSPAPAPATPSIFAETLAETAHPKPETRGRPPGKESSSRVKNIRFDIEHGVELLADLAEKNSVSFDWDGSAYPKTKRTQGPSQEGLVVHAPVLLHLLTLAPNGYPCPYRLRDLLCKLHIKFTIFGDNHFLDCNPLMKTAMAAADRWRIMCKHCLMLKLSGTTILFDDLTRILSLIHAVLPLGEAVLPEPAATAFQLKESVSPDVDSQTQDTWTPPRPVVPYLSDGVIDWGQVEDDLEEPETETTWDCEIFQPDLCKIDSSRLNPYFHHSHDTDCAITGHRCACCIGPPPPKKCRVSPAENTIPAAPAEKVDETEYTARPVPTAIHPIIEANKSAEESFVFPPNRLGDLETKTSRILSVEDKLLEAKASRILKEEGKGKVKGSGKNVLTATVGMQNVKGKGKHSSIPVKGKLGGLKSQEQPETQSTHPDTEDQVIGPPWKLAHRWNPLHDAQCTLKGTVGGQTDTFITKITTAEHPFFSTIMQQLHQEAIAGALKTIGQAVHRRNQLLEPLGKRPAETASASRRSDCYETESYMKRRRCEPYVKDAD